MRRGRIVRMGAACAVLLLLVYALHKWSSENIAFADDMIDSEAQVGYFKFHRDVYPTLKSGKVLRSNVLLLWWLMTAINWFVQLHAPVRVPACLRPPYAVFLRHFMPCI